MGMYDDLVIDGEVYETKDFECQLDRLELVHGRLYRRKLTGEGAYEHLMDAEPVEFHGICRGWWVNTASGKLVRYEFRFDRGLFVAMRELR